LRRRSLPVFLVPRWLAHLGLFVSVERSLCDASRPIVELPLSSRWSYASEVVFLSSPSRPSPWSYVYALQLAGDFLAWLTCGFAFSFVLTASGLAVATLFHIFVV